MRKFGYVLLCIFLLSFCSQKQPGVEKIIEEGVEVVLNQIEPYLIEGEPSTLTLEKVLSIDTENDDIASTGLIDVYRFDVDSEGSIYFLIPPTGPGDFVYKFDKSGRFLTSFARMGQGPYEMEYPDSIHILIQDKVLVTEGPMSKTYIFSKDGEPLQETKVELSIYNLYPLDNGTYLIKLVHDEDLMAKYLPWSLNLFDSEFKKVKELDRYTKYANKRVAEKSSEKIVSGIHHVFHAEISSEHIFIGNCERGYEIQVYDLEGNLIRKIRKEYEPVSVSDEYKEEFLKPWVEGGDEWSINFSQKFYFPQHWYPFHSFFSDEEGRLYVMTHEQGEKPGEYLFDIFNSEGIFICRKSINAHWEPVDSILFAKVKSNHLYCVRVKVSDYKELVVNKMIWQ